jgi:signal transduction histidine kinase
VNLERRIVVVSVVVGAICTLASASVITMGVIHGGKARAGSLTPMPGTPAHAACLAAPAEWFSELGSVRVETVERATRLGHDGLRVGAGDGPCTRFVLSGWRSPPPGGPLRLALLLALLVTTSMATALALIFVTRPLRARVQALTQTVQTMGEDVAAAPAAPGGASDALGLLARALHDTALRVDRTTRGLEAQVLAVSHDLRTPLTALRLSLERAMATGVERRDLAEMIGDVLNLSRLAETLVFAVTLRHDVLRDRQEVSLQALASASCRRLSVLAEARSVTLVLLAPVDCRVHGPSLGVEHAMVNLIGNALRHAATHVAVGLDVEGEVFSFWVEDDGPGMAEVLPPTLHEALERRALRSAGSLGLGLPLVRTIGESCGWTLTITSRPTLEGTRVTLRGRR